MFAATLVSRRNARLRSAHCVNPSLAPSLSTLDRRPSAYKPVQFMAAPLEIAEGEDAFYFDGVVDHEVRTPVKLS
jgi:hypothetical protein